MSRGWRRLGAATGSNRESVQWSRWRNACAALWLGALAMGLGGWPGPATAAGGLPETIARIKPAIVAVGTVLPTRRPPGKFIGTGFVVAGGNYALSNAHVIPKALNAERRETLAVLTGGSGGPVRRARVVATDTDHDIAVLRFDGPPLPALSLGDSTAVREGETYAFTGFPIGTVLGFRPVTHTGIISAITPIAIPQLSARRLDPKLIRRLSQPYNVFQLDATAYPGNSGSPLYGVESGVVIGIINKVFVKETKENVLQKPSGISYAIPIQYAKALLRKAGVSF